MTPATKTQKELLAENEELRLRLEEAEETLRAIGSGEVDAFVVSGLDGEKQIFTLKGADYPYRILVENMSEGAATLATDGTILYCNNRLASLLHIQLEKLIGTQLGNYVAPADLPLFFPLLEKCAEKHVKEEITMLSSIGSAVPVLFSCSTHNLSGASSISAVITDLTQQKRNEQIAASEAALRISEERLTLATSATQTGMFDWNIAKGTVLWTQTHEALFGYAPVASSTTTEFDSSKWSDRVHPEDLAFVMEESNRCMRERIPLNVQYRIIWPDGSLHWIETKGVYHYESNGTASRLIGVVREITESKQAEDALAAAYRQTQNIIDNTPAIVYAFDLEERFVLVNAAVAKLFNSTRDQIIGKRRGDFMPQADADWHEANDRKVIEAGRALEFEEQSELPGRSITWLTTKFPLFDATGHIFAVGGISTDISSRKQAEKALRESEERHRLLSETMLQGVVHQDASGRIISMNPAAERILGKSPEDFLEKSSVDVELDTIRENGEIFPGVEHPTMVAMRTGLPVRGVVMGVFNPKVQEYRWIGIDAVPVFRPGEDAPSEVYSIFGDITERKNAEMALQESERRIQQALQVSRSFTFDWLPVTDQVVRSASCGSILNLAGDEAVNDTGDHYFQCIHPHDRERFVQILRELTPTADSYITEYRYVRKDGSEITLEETGQASFDATGKMLRLVGVTTDITVRKQAEEALRIVHAELELRVEERTAELAQTINVLKNEIIERQEAEKALFKETSERLKAIEALREKEQMLIQQSRLAAMGDMINNIAHQWRQPLNVLGLISQQMQLFYEMGSFNKEYLDESVKKSMNMINHMSRTIDDFRDFFKPDKDKVEFALNDVIAKTLALIEDSFSNQQITIEFKIRDSLTVYGYPNEYSQALLNILLNARDAFMENCPASPKVSVTMFKEDDRAVVTIADNAGGIPADNLYKIFEPYFTTKGPDKGTGVGLFMSKTIIEKNMGGRLTARNTDVGAEFRIEV